MKPSTTPTANASMPGAVRLAALGAGARRHIALVAAEPRAGLAAAVDPSPERVARAAPTTPAREAALHG